MVKIGNNFQKKNLERYRRPGIFSPPKQKQKREIRVHWGEIKISLLVGAIITGGYFLFFSDTFKVKEIIVEGNSFLPTEKIVESIPAGQNVFLFKTRLYEKSLLLEHPEIKTVDIIRGIPNALKVVVAERDGQVVWQTGLEKYYLSSEGEVSHLITGEEGSNLPLIIDKKNIPVVSGQAVVSPNFVAFILNLTKTMKDETNISPLRYEVEETTFDVNAITDAGFYVKFNSLRSSKKQLESLKTVLISKRDQVHEYVDLRVDGWAYYK
jgi:cell division septal protein FtsQ